MDKIEKEIKVKNCKICKQDKDLSEYHKVNKGKYYNSYCKECSKQISKQHRIDNPDHYKQYYQNNVDKIKQYIKQWAQNNPKYMSQWNKAHPNKNKKLNTSIPAGVYGIYEHDDLLYIGESIKPYARIAQHFSNSLTANYSPIAQAIGNGELQRENLSFKMLEYVDDDSARKHRETVLIQRYQPRYNNYHVNA